MEELIVKWERSELNIDIFQWSQNFVYQNNFLDMFFVFISEGLIFLMIIFFALFFWKKIWRDKKITIKELMVYFSGAAITYIVTFYLKNSLSIERPFIWLNQETLTTHSEIYNSFPSGHSALAFALASSLFMYHRKWGSVMLGLASLVALGRVFAGVHFPLDILVGAFIGILFPVVSYSLFRALNIRNPHHYYGTKKWVENREKYFSKK